MNAPDHIPHDPRNSERVEPIVADAVADQLPAPARDLLVLASQIRDPAERRFAIDRAIDAAKARFPECFHPSL